VDGRRRTVLDGALALLLVAAVAVTFTPWLRTGSARRSSYEVVRAAERLEVLDPTAARVGRVVWATLPLAAASGVLLLVVERRRAASIAGLWVAAVVGSLSFALTRAPEVADDGVVVAAMVAGGLAVVAFASLLDGRRTTT
jgi:hypothetical protein